MDCRLDAEDPDHEQDMSKIQVVADVFERVATIRTKGPTSKAHFTIEVPARSDVQLRVRAGEVRIEGIEGNKDVRMNAGELYIDVDPESLHHVHASVSIGDLNARSLGVEKGSETVSTRPATAATRSTPATTGRTAPPVP